MPNEKMSVREIIHAYTDGRLSSRPEYYSGRGVNRGDLNASHIKMVYDGVLKELGEDAAKAFVEMLRELKDLSATGFLNSLYRLERSGWVFDKAVFNQSGDGIAAVDEVTAFCTVASMFGRNSDPELEAMFSRQIANEFLALIGVKPIVTKSRYSSLNSYYADPGVQEVIHSKTLSKRLR
jgi:hypothetical protein